MVTQAFKGAIRGGRAWTPARLAAAAGGPVLFWASPKKSSTLNLTGSTINSIADAAGGADVLAKINTPTLNTTDLVNGRPAIVLGTANQLVSATGGITGAQAHALYLLCDFNVAAASQPDSIMVFGTAGAADTTSPLGLFNNPYFSGGNNSTFLPQGRTPAPDGLIHVLGGHYNGSQKYLTLDGAVMGDSNNIRPSFTHNISAGFGFGKYTAAINMNGSRVREAIWCSRELTPAEHNLLLNYWIRDFALSRTAPVIYCEGDSLTLGTNSSNPGVVGWPSMLVTALNTLLTAAGRTNCSRFLDAAVGRTLVGTSPDMLGRIAGTTIDATLLTTSRGHRSQRREWEIGILCGGANDIINAGANSATVISRLTTGGQNMRAQGRRSMILTLPPGSPNFYTAQKEIYRQEVNAWILGSAIAAGAADAVGNSEAGGLVYDATCYGSNFPNDIHPNDVGYQRWANGIVAAAYSLIP